MKWMIIYEDDSTEIVRGKTILEAINKAEEPDSICSVIKLSPLY